MSWCDATGVPAFVEVAAPTDDERHTLLQTLITRLMKLLTRRGILVEDMGQTYLAEPDADADEACTLRTLQAAAVTYRIAFGPCAGQVELQLKTPWRDGTTHLVMSPLEFMQRLAARVPRPRLHLIRFGVRITSLREVSGLPLRDHGGLAPNARRRPLVVPQEPAQTEQSTGPTAAACAIETAQARPGRISWARLLKRVLDIDMQHCPNCGAGERKIIAAILERPVIEKILTHLGLDPQPPPPRAGVRGAARFRSLSPALNHAGRHKHHAPGLQRKTAAGAATHDASARHDRNQGPP